MLAVSGEQVVAGFQRRHQPDHRGLLTEVEVAVPAALAWVYIWTARSSNARTRVICR
jgi:hypothetical protein